MSDLLAPADVEVWCPPDSWLASMIRRLRGMPAGEPLPPGLLESWRRYVQVEIRRHALARARGRPAGPMPRPRRTGAPDPAEDLVRDMLASPEGQFYMTVAAGMLALLAAVAHAFAAEAQVRGWHARRELDLRAREDAAELVRYIDWKAGGAAYHEDPRDPLWARYKAACNAVTVRRALAWRVRLADTGQPLRALRDLLAEMAAVGVALIDDVAPLRIWDVDPGRPRGLVPDPPEPDEEDDAARRGGSAVTAKPEPPGGGR